MVPRLRQAIGHWRKAQRFEDVAKTYSLEDASAARESVEQGHPRGKLVLKVD